jgi:hypothetical protein|tara:strand:+ start:148 stop:423 length:276 start_codon:yes stop_codon:yes gene_type:complete
MKRANPIVKGKDAEQLLEHPLLQEGFDSIERDVVNALASTGLVSGEYDEALELVRTLQANRRLKKKLWEYVSHGKLEARAEEQRAKQNRGR